MSSETAVAARRENKQWTEIVAVVLLSLVAVMTAWCGFESSKWGGAMSISFSQASSNRIKASDANSSSRDAFQLDAMVFAQWLVAKQAGDQELANYLQGVFSDPLDVAFAAWDRQDEDAIRVARVRACRQSGGGTVHQEGRCRLCASSHQ